MLADRVHIYRWDLDKTYLDTDFDSLRALIRTAREAAHEKRSLPGATALVRAIARRPGHRICIVSGSPTQLRAKLQEKLRLDGVDYHSLTLKDTVKSLRRGRLRAVKDQFGYKLPVLLTDRVGLGAAVRETLFGDDAEVDALIYSIYADALAGRLRPADVSRILEVAGAYDDGIERALEAMTRIPHADVVDRIFIRLERGHPVARYEPLGRRVVPIRSWWQAALVLAERGSISHADARVVLMSVGHDPWSAGGLVQDLVRAGHLSADVVERMEAEPDIRDASAKAVQHLALERTPAQDDRVPDYVALIQERMVRPKREKTPPRVRTSK